VAEGEQVTPDRALVIVEAMKMENEVHATASGTVARIAVVAGATVDAGALLIEIDLATTPP
jgi:pyruvate carboxylase subunit B